MTALVIKYDKNGAAHVELGEVAESGPRGEPSLPFVSPLPDAIQRRIQQLLERNATGIISADERDELEAYVEAGLDVAAKTIIAP